MDQEYKTYGTFNELLNKYIHDSEHSKYMYICQDNDLTFHTGRLCRDNDLTFHTGTSESCRMLWFVVYTPHYQWAC